MATCGFCKTKGLQKVPNRGNGEGLETHYRPNTRVQCEGMSTTPGYTTRKKR